MSRHEIPALNPEAHIVIVGWDKPLQTFFIQVIDRAKENEDDNHVLWLGCSAQEIKSVSHLCNIMKGYATLSRAMSSILYLDRDEGR